MQGCPNVAVQSKPAKKAVAKESFKVSALAFAPAEIQGFKAASFALTPQQLSCDESKRPFNVLFWAVQFTEDSSIANVRWSARPVFVACAPQAKSVDNKLAFAFKVLVTFKALEDGDELVVLGDVAENEPLKKKPHQ